MIDIATVVFPDEIKFIKLQAESVSLYCQDLDVGNIYVIVNDSDQVCADIDPTWWGDFQDRVKIIPRSVFNCTWVENGWVSQQVLKLLACTLNYREYTMVLDAKTVLVRPMLKKEIFMPDGKLSVGWIPIWDVFKPSAKITGELFGIEVNDVINPAGVPFFFHNDSVRELFVEVKRRTGKTLPVWFQEKGMVTEFILYTGFIAWRDGHLGVTIDNSQPNNPLEPSPTNVCNICHTEVGIFDSKFPAHDSNYPWATVSVHRRTWPQLTHTQQQRFRDFLINRGISTAKDLI